MTDTTCSEFEAIGRIQAALDAIRASFERGAKRSLPDRKRLWGQISFESAKCDHALDPGTKPRAAKARTTSVAAIPAPRREHPGDIARAAGAPAPGQATIKVAEGAA